MWPKVARVNHPKREVHGALCISAHLKFERPRVSCVGEKRNFAPMKRKAFGTIFFSVHRREKKVYLFI